MAKEYPRHRWYTYKEGFSPVFVKDMLQRFCSNKGEVIFDPFGGIGTTVLESSLNGYKSFSNDINPLSNFISKIKSEVYSFEDKDSIRSHLSELSPGKLVKKAAPPNNSTVITYFSPQTLDLILKIQYWVDNIGEEKTRNVFSLSILSLLEKLSTHRKDGNGVKRKRNQDSISEIETLITMMSTNIEMFLRDIDETVIKVPPKILSQSSFIPYALDNAADLVVTSPPYANCFDYSKVYMIELWFGKFFMQPSDQKTFRESSIISHVHYKWNKRHEEYRLPFVEEKIVPYLKNQKLWDKKIPEMISGYFSDLGKVLVELIPNLNKNSTIGIVVGNSVYAGLPIATDLIVAEIAINLGYQLRAIETYRTLTPSSQQYKIMRDEDKRFLRESMVLLRWE